MSFLRIDWSATKFPQALLKNEQNLRSNLQNLVGNEVAIYRVEKVDNNEHDYRIIVSDPVRDELVDEVEKNLGTKKIDWVLVQREKVQRF